MTSGKTIKLPAKNVEKIINDLSLLIVSMDQIGSTYYDDPKQQALEMDKYFSQVNAFKKLAQARGILTKAYNSQSTKADVLRSETRRGELAVLETK
ncbi:MAG TPA: hypothetical protein VH280_18530 [Verrucomicrobiae bacterium]|jgi:hypothetical protein|nr:hypothetical protein [Verrucomicrobiae bacterium]